MKTISSEAICMIETWKMEQEFYYTKKMHMRWSSDEHFARSLRIADNKHFSEKSNSYHQIVKPKNTFCFFFCEKF